MSYHPPSDKLLRDLNLPPTAARTLHDRYRHCLCQSTVHGEEYVQKYFLAMCSESEQVLWDHLMESNHV